MALTAASLSWSYEYEIQLDAEHCAYWITGIHAQAVFNPGDSWVKPEHRTAAVLSHEQGHFDIAQVYKLLLDERARPLIDVSQICEGRTIKKASEFTERRIAEQVGTIFDEVWQQFASAQESYDDQTAHGIALEAQRTWTEKLHGAVHLGQWQVVVDELKQ